MKNALLPGGRKFAPPRHEVVPAFASHSADDVVELLSAVDLQLDGHQHHILTGATGVLKNGKWAASQVGVSEPRQNGKSVTLLARTLAGVLLFNEKRVIHSAHEVKTALEAFRKLENLCKDYDWLSALVKRYSHNNGREGIEFKNGAIVSYLARSVGSGRGFSADTILLDEAQELSFDIYAAILPTLSAQVNPQVWLAGTPPSGRMNGEVFTHTRNRAIEGSAKRAAWYEWSIEVDPGSDEPFDYMDPTHWLATNPACPERITLETIEDEANAMDEDTFRRERLGEWTGGNTASVIPLPTWTRQADAEGSSAVDQVLCFDVNPARTHASVALAGYTSSDKDDRFLEMLAQGPGTDWLGPMLKKTLEENPGIRAVIVDDASPAASLVGALRDLFKIQVTLTNGKDMVRACGQGYDGFVNGTIYHSDQPELTAAMKGSVKRPLLDAWGLSRRRTEVDISVFVAGILALYGVQMPRVKRPVIGERGRRKVTVSR